MVRRATRRVRFDCELKGLSFALKIWDHVGLFAGENRMAQPATPQLPSVLDQLSNEFSKLYSESANPNELSTVGG